MVVVASGTNSFAKEMTVRKRFASIFNKREDDFPSLKEYNDYLEEVEDMIVSYVEGIDVEAIDKKIKEYVQENKDQISEAQARKAIEYAAAVEASKGKPAQNDEDEAIAQKSTQAGISMQGHYAPAVAGGAIAQPWPTGAGPQPLQEMHGYHIDDEEMMKLKAERGGKAGGWSLELSKKRALEEAFGSIWI